MTDKLILSNDSALVAKYAAHAAVIHSAIQRLITADAGRGLTTQYLSLDDAAAMAALGAAAVTDVRDEQQAKDAIDAVYRAVAPDYLMILGAPDVVPHQSLINPISDGDLVTPSDLPYACDAPFSGLTENFTGPSRIVGRLPDVTGGSDADAFAAVIDHAAMATSRGAAYRSYFSVSTETWQASTALSLTTVFGNAATMHVSPTEGPAWTAGEIAPLSHFINCHGNTGTPTFFGEGGGSVPVSHDAALLGGTLSGGTVAAVECCYGAELYDPTFAGGQMGIANTYIADGAYGYWGSTNIAYGPPSGNGAADLIAQFYLKGILAGASSGRAAADARLEFVSVASPLNPVALKTLAQFILLGDPSIQPGSTSPPPADALAKAHGITPEELQKNVRAVRRRRLVVRGLELSQNRAVAASVPYDGTSPDMMNQLRAVADRAGLSGARIRSYPVRNAGTFLGLVPKGLAQKAPEPTVFHVILGDGAEAPADRQTLRLFKAIVVEESDGKVRSIEEFDRKGQHGSHWAGDVETRRRRLEVRA